MSLTALIQDRAVKARIVEDCVALLEEQVAMKKGISGLALKTTYRALQSVGRKYVPGAIGRLLPEAFAAIDPMWREGLQAGDPVEYLIQHQARTANTLLQVTDARIQHADGIVRVSYEKLRKSVQGDIEAAIPSFARIIAAHAQAVQQV